MRYLELPVMSSAELVAFVAANFSGSAILQSKEVGHLGIMNNLDGVILSHLC
jgi:hypothetical protein